MNNITPAWAVLKDGQIQHLDGGIAKRLAVFKMKADADRDCDKKDEVVVAVEIRIVPWPPRKEVIGICGVCDKQVPRGFYTCRGDGSHQAIT